MSELTAKNNFDDVFLRNVIVGFSSFIYDIIEIKEYKNNIENIRKVKCFFSSGGDQQMLYDFFSDNHLYYNQLSSKLEGNYKSIPSGIFIISDGGLSSSGLSGGFERMEFERESENEYGVEVQTVSAMTQLINEEFSVDLEIKCSSEIERLKVYDTILENFYKVRKFFIRYKGFNKLPITVTFPEQMSGERNIKFRTNSQEKILILKVSLKLMTSRPIVDETTVMLKQERIKKFTTALSFEK